MDLMDLVSERVKVIAEGVWREKDVIVRFDERFTPYVNREIRAAALSRFLTRKEYNPNLFDGDARHLSLRDCTLTPDFLDLAVGPLKYSEYDVCRRSYIEAFGWKHAEFLTGTGSCVVLITNDAKIAMHKRTPDGDFLAKTSLIGGIYDGGTLFAHMRKELWEELKIGAGDINSLVLLAITNRLEARISHEFNFFAEVSLSSDRLHELQRDVSDKEGELFFVDWDPRAFHKFISARHKELPAGHVAALILAGRHMWGKEWSKIL